MTHADLKSKVQQAINLFYAYDSNLLTQDASEWSMAHRLAVYLEHEIAEWNVDCEYNRQGLSKDPKSMADGPNVRPDIILHHRGRVEMDHNLLVVELKKHKSDADLGKALEYTRPPEGSRKFQYQYGLTLSLFKRPILHWFMDGRQIS